jgi:hypothetical protein
VNPTVNRATPRREAAGGPGPGRAGADPRLADQPLCLPHRHARQGRAREAGHFDEDELAYVIALITTINALNRINVATRTPPAAA